MQSAGEDKPSQTVSVQDAPNPMIGWKLFHLNQGGQCETFKATTALLQYKSGWFDTNLRLKSRAMHRIVALTPAAYVTSIISAEISPIKKAGYSSSQLGTYRFPMTFGNCEIDNGFRIKKFMYTDTWKTWVINSIPQFPSTFANYSHTTTRESTS